MQKLRSLPSYLFLLAAVAQAAGQSEVPSNQPVQPNATATLHADSRLVLVDVVVKHRRQPVNGLTASDFILLEDGKPQKIAFFDAHQGARTAAAPPKTVTPADYFSNDNVEAPSSLNVILFDTLNTPATDQLYARKQMIQFLTTLPPGYHLALFELGARLRMLTRFNQTSQQLVAAASKLVPQISPLLETDEDLLQQQRLIDRSKTPYNADSVAAMQQFVSEASATVAQNRVRLTLQGLNALTSAMSGFHGRKNVIWLSEYFPVSFGLMTDNGRFSDVRRYDDVMRGTASTLSSAQVALYPIDVRGLTSGFFGNASLGGGPADNILEIGEIEARHVSMDDIAEQTGGHAYYNTNDLKFAMQRSLESGTDYYTLAYVPPHGTDSKYHRIDVRFTRSGLSSEHRKGYFAMPVTSASTVVSEFVGAVQPATPELDRLHLKARLLLPDKQHANTRVECTIRPEDLTFVDQPNNRKFVRFHVLSVTWDRYLNTVAKASNTLELRFSPEQYARVLRDGITTVQEMKLTKPGRYQVRIAVMDDANNRIGSLEIPVEISSESKLAQK